MRGKIKYIIIGLLALVAIRAHSFPETQGYVNDLAGIMDQNVKDRLESLTRLFERHTGNEIVVATIPSLEDSTVEDYAVELFEKWGIGKKGQDNGVLILVAPHEKKMRIEVGYGLEGSINDALAGRIIRDTMVPWFQKEDFGAGILNGTTEVIQIISKKNNIDFDVAKASGLGGQVRYLKHTSEIQSRRGSSCVRGIGIIVFLIFFIPFFIRHPFLALFLLSGMGGGRSRGGFGGGGFGGFGGGMSGGGGASGSW